MVSKPVKIDDIRKVLKFVLTYVRGYKNFVREIIGLPILRN